MHNPSLLCCVTLKNSCSIFIFIMRDKPIPKNVFLNCSVYIPCSSAASFRNIRPHSFLVEIFRIRTKNFIEKTLPSSWFKMFKLSFEKLNGKKLVLSYTDLRGLYNEDYAGGSTHREGSTGPNSTSAIVTPSPRFRGSIITLNLMTIPTIIQIFFPKSLMVPLSKRLAAIPNEYDI